MTIDTSPRYSLESIVRWTARVVGGLLVLLVLATFVGDAIAEGGTGLVGLEGRDYIMFAALFLMVAGLIVAWRWEGAGGGMALLGFAVFWLANYLSTGRKGVGWVIGLFAVVGLLFVFSWWKNRANKGNQLKTPTTRIPQDVWGNLNRKVKKTGTFGDALRLFCV